MLQSDGGRSETALDFCLSRHILAKNMLSCVDYAFASLTSKSMIYQLICRNIFVTEKNLIFMMTLRIDGFPPCLSSALDHS